MSAIMVFESPLPAKSFGAFTINYGPVFAEAAVVVIPAVVLLAFQRFFVSSVASSGGKE
jgi:putative chitobiose transport system permease protein